MYKNREINKKKPFNFLWIFIILLLIITAVYFLYQKEIVSFWDGLKKVEKKVETPRQEEPKSTAIYCLIDQSVKQSQVGTSTPIDLAQAKSPTIKQCFSIDENGVIFRESPFLSGGPFLLIYDSSKQDAKIGELAIRPTVLRFISQLKNSELNKKVNFTNFVLISPISDDVEAITATGWKIFFDTSKNVDKQLGILSDILKAKGAPKEYIDLRLENKVYFK